MFSKEFCLQSGSSECDPQGADWNPGSSGHLPQVGVRSSGLAFTRSLLTGGLFLASFLRKDLSLSQRECEELKIRLGQKEKEAADALRASGAPRVAGLCLKCAQHEAVLADTQGHQHVQTIDRLTKSVETYTRLKTQCINLLFSAFPFLPKCVKCFQWMSRHLSNILGTEMSCW